MSVRRIQVKINADKTVTRLVYGHHRESRDREIALKITLKSGRSEKGLLKPKLTSKKQLLSTVYRNFIDLCSSAIYFKSSIARFFMYNYYHDTDLFMCAV